MDVMFYVDIEDSQGNKLGSGPIQNAGSWSSTRRMSRAGEFRFTMPASDPQRHVIEEKRVARCKAVTDSGIITVGSGIIDSVETVPSSDGNVMLEVSGDDLLREVTHRSIHFQALQFLGSGVSHAEAVSTLSNYVPLGWTLVPEISPPNDDIYYQFAGETSLTAAIKIAELSGVEFYVSGDRTIVFSDTWEDTGIRAIEVPDSPDINNPQTCYITDIRAIDESYDLISRIYPYGSGQGDSAFGMGGTTRTAPAGYTLNAAQNHIINDSVELTFGKIERVKQYRDVEKVGSTSDDDIAAANTLFDLALAELERDSQVARFFDLSIAHCPQLLRPMQQIRCVFRRFADGVLVADINQILNIIDATITIDDRGLRTSRLTVGSVGRVPRRDTDSIVELVLRSKLRV